MGRVLFALLLALSLAPAAFADGKVFRFGVAELPSIPDQQALICYDQQAQTQTLAIETRFRPADGPVQPYAWVVPLPGPGAPTITPATTGLFPTLRQLFQPRLISTHWPEFLWLSLGAAVCIVIGVQATRGGWSVAIKLMFLLMLCACIIGMLLPALGTARSSGVIAGADVVVLERSLVGDYEITTIAATPEAADPSKALAAWLESSGFKQPPSVAPVLADYAKRNWVFACVKLLNLPKPSPDGTLTPHPLVFTFKTPQAVYPMALTGVGNGPLTLDLYVFGQGTAQIPGMSIVRSSLCQLTEPDVHPATVSHLPGNSIAIAHDGLKPLVSQFPHATKLSDVLSPEQQSRDLPVSFSEFTPAGEVKYSKAAARNTALDFAGGTLLIAIIGLVIVAAVMKREAPWFNRRLFVPILLAVLVGAGRWAILPTVEGKSVSLRDLRRQTFRYQDLVPVLQANFSGNPTAPSFAEVRAVIAEEFKKNRDTLPREEDSPWNYTLTVTPRGDVRFAWYDAVGKADSVTIWSKPLPLDAKP